MNDDSFGIHYDIQTVLRKVKRMPVTDRTASARAKAICALEELWEAALEELWEAAVAEKGESK